ncbi:MAG: WcaF family extracellular polysaccharide biosynthesis acetyltransferase [Nitrospinota bacterium]|nr:WcaF family extracellular polysaccharide biosynthesis acetyltransferase [Nitrospinota bacterium]
MIQDLSKFKQRPGSSGRSRLTGFLWRLVRPTIFALSTRNMHQWRCFLLRLFGATVGLNVVIRPSVKIFYPWRVNIGNNVWIGDDVDLYSLDEIVIGNNTVISQRCFLCTAGHDYRDPSFLTYTAKIVIEDEVWVAAEVLIGPGVTIGRGAVIGARSSVWSNMPMEMLCFGSPAKPIRARLAPAR